MNEEIKRLPNGDFTCGADRSGEFTQRPRSGYVLTIEDGHHVLRRGTEVIMRRPVSHARPDMVVVDEAHLYDGPLPPSVKARRCVGPEGVLRLVCGDKVLSKGDTVTCDAEGCESGCACPGDCVTQTTVAAKPPAAPPPQGTWPFPTKAVRPPHTCVTCRHVKRHFYDDPCNHCFAVAGRPKWEAVPPPAAPLA